MTFQTFIKRTYFKSKKLSRLMYATFGMSYVQVKTFPGIIKPKWDSRNAGAEEPVLTGATCFGEFESPAKDGRGAES
jgi:hypothetical protein